MIVAERKPIPEILEMVREETGILIVGCGTCVTVCMAGGEKEAALLGSALRLARAGSKAVITQETVERQCEYEFLEEIEEQVAEASAVISLACGAGVQTMAGYFKKKPIFPGLNTTFIGMPEEQGVWEERCMACGNCMLDKTGGICPVARCAKNIMNGPCGGSQDGKCEIDPDTECAWQLIYDRLQELDRLDFMLEFLEPKDWSSSRDGGPRKVIREDMQL